MKSFFTDKKNEPGEVDLKKAIGKTYSEWTGLLSVLIPQEWKTSR